MTRMRKALWAAAVLAIVPVAAHAEDREQRHHDRADNDRGARQDTPRPAPPQMVRPQAPAPMPAVQGGHGAPPLGSEPRRGMAFDGPRAGGDQAPPSPGNRGGWNGGSWNRGDGRPATPQSVSPAQSQPDRGQWRRDDRGGDNRAVQNDGRRADDHRRDNRGGQANAGDRRWDGDNRPGNDNRRWDNDNRRANDNRWGNGDRRNDNDRRWDNRDRRWEGNGAYRHDQNWRNDRRYDWRGWRDSHRNLFRWRYSAPRGYQYRPVWRGFYLEPFFYGSSYWLSDPFEYRLPPVEWPLRWVRYYDDALLVDTTTGEVVDVIQSFFW